MFKIFILDVNLLKTFLTATDTDYVNAIISNGFSHLLINQAEIFSVLDLKTITKEESCHLRIPKVILSKLIREGSMELSISDGMVEAKLLNEKENCYCTVKFIKQDFPINDFKYKMDLIGHATENQEQIDLTQFESLEKIMRTTKSVLNVSDGVAMLTATLGRVYKEVSPSYKFAVTPFAYNLLKRCSKLAFSVDNYLVAQNNGLLIAVTKCKSSDNSEYKLFLEQKASLVCEIGLIDLKYFLSRIPSSDAIIKFIVTDKEAHFNLGSISYSVPIAVSKLRQSGGDNALATIPESIIREVLFNIETDGAILAKKRTFTQIRVKDLLIVF